MALRDPGDTNAIARAATNLWGSDAARLPRDADLVGDLAPRVVVEPRDAATLAQTLQWADGERLAIVPRGGGTKLTWGTAPSRLDVMLSMTRLNAPIDHCAGDLTATVPSGASLDAVNQVLRRENQWLPLDPAGSDRATIGGILATNDSGPRRQRYGTPRDLIIGIEMALVDGRTAKAGGRVVKNVAGYDLARLLCGSFGSLAVITSATFKLAPVPPASRTVVATVSDARRLGVLALAIAAAPLNPSAIELESPPTRLMVRFESTLAAAEQQAVAASDLLARHEAATAILRDGAETDAWREYEARLWRTPGTLVKIAVLPADVADALEQVERVTASHAVDYRVGGRAALGVLFLRLSGDLDRQSAVVAKLRRDVTARGGSAVLVAAESALKARIDPWGDVGDGLEMMRAVKARFDPNGTLSPGRGPGGL